MCTAVELKVEIKFDGKGGGKKERKIHRRHRDHLV